MKEVRTPGGIVATVSGPAEGTAAVVLVHGAADRSTSFGAVRANLADVRVTTYDRRGYGDSVGLDPAASLSDHARDLLEVIGARPSVVVAHSFGSHVAVLAAIASPGSVRALGLWEPPVPWMDFWPPEPRRSLEAIASGEDPGKIAERIYVAVSGRDAWNRLSEEAREERRREGVAFCADLATELEAPYDWADLDVPCVIGHGSRSWPYSQEASHHIAVLIGQPEFVIEGAPHVAHVSDPEGFADFVRAAVGRSAPG